MAKAIKEKERLFSNLKEKVRKYGKLQFVYIEDDLKLAKLYDIGIIDFKRDYPQFKSDDSEIWVKMCFILFCIHIPNLS